MGEGKDLYLQPLRKGCSPSELRTERRTSRNQAGTPAFLSTPAPERTTRTTPARRLAMHVQGGRIKEHLSSHQIYFIYFHHVILCRGVMHDLVKGTSNIDKQNL